MMRDVCVMGKQRSEAIILSKIVVLIVGVLCFIFLFSAGQAKAKNLFESKIYNDVVVRSKMGEGINITSSQKASQ